MIGTVTPAVSSHLGRPETC